MELYRYFIKLVEMFSFLGAWQRRSLALWCSGVVAAGSCQIPRVADALLGARPGTSGALERRLGRFLGNPRISDELLSRAWIKWLVQHYVSPHWIVLVDETHLGAHLRVMMVSLAYQQRAIPLLWHCYPPRDYPQQGQVEVIMALLRRLRLWVPNTISLTVQADRGIGTSPALICALEQAGFMYLLRVQGQVRIRLGNGQVHALNSLVKPGECWYGGAEVFKKAGWLLGYVCLDWRLGQPTPWCLLSNCRWRRSDDYRQRAWHEHSFRDLKSFGFNWQQSHVWSPDRAHRLLFVLTLAYCWVLSQAQACTSAEPISPSRCHPRHSLFRRGLRWVRQQLNTDRPNLSPELCLVPGRVLLC